MLQEVFDLFRAREPIPFMILAMVAVGWIVILERLIMLQLVYRVNFPKFNTALRKMLAAGDMERARTYCLASGKVGVPLIAARAVDTYETDAFRVRMIVSEETLAFMPRIRRRISQLPNLATASILLGALASVHGIWQSFHMTQTLELGVRSLAFTAGLANGLTPLALALVAAIVLVVPYGILDAIAHRLEGEIEHSITMFLNILAPEGTTMVAAAPTPSMPAYMPPQEASTRSEAVASANDTSNKGMEEDVSGAGLEQVPDEEEII